MDVLSKLNVKSDAQFDGNLTVGTCTYVRYLNIDTTAHSFDINATSQITSTSEFFLGSGTGEGFLTSFISSSANYGKGSIIQINSDNSVAKRLNCVGTFIGNNIEQDALVIHSTTTTLFESDILFKSNNFIEFDVGPMDGCQSNYKQAHIAFNLFDAINTSNLATQNDIFTVYGRGVDHTGALLTCTSGGTEFLKNSVKLISAGYASSLPVSVFTGETANYSGNYVRFQLSNDERSDSSDTIGNSVDYMFTSRGITINFDNSGEYPGKSPGTYDIYCLITVNGNSIFDGIMPIQKQFTNVEIPASCQLVNFGHIGTEFKSFPPMVQLTDNENFSIIHANIQFESCTGGYNLMVGIEHDDVIPAGKYKLSVFGY